MNYCVAEYLTQEIIISYWCWRPQWGLREGTGFLEKADRSWMDLSTVEKDKNSCWIQLTGESKRNGWGSCLKIIKSD